MMAENTNRNVFGLHGVTGMLIATVLLLTILGVLTVLGIGVQANEAQNFYQIDNASELQMNSSSNAGHYKLK
jgi:hypothetical protein